MRGTWSSPSMSNKRMPPTAVCNPTLPALPLTTSPMMIASRPSVKVRINCTTSSATSALTMAIIFPSFAKYNGSYPNTCHTACTSSRTGISDSCKRIPFCAELAISCNVVAKPPRVGSRKKAMSLPKVSNTLCAMT